MKNLLKHILVLAILLPLSSLSSSVESFPQELFQAERDQPRLQKLFRWDNRIVAQAGEFYFEIDPVKCTSMPIHFVGDRSMISLTTALGKPFALGGNGDHYRVLFHRSGKNDWDMIRVPQNEEGKEDRYSIIVGDENSLVLLGQKSFKIFNGKNWINRDYSNEFSPSNSDPCVLWRGNVYYGYDRGEWGGGLRKLDLSTGQWKEVTGKLPTIDYSKPQGQLVFVDDTPLSNVTDISITPDDNLKIICGCSHMGMYWGQIARVSDNDLVNELYISVRNDNNEWDFPVTDFDALRFNNDGDQVLLSPRLGLLTYRNDEWKRLTPHWEDHAYLTSFLILNNDQYLIGTYDAGIVVIDLKKKTEKVIRLATSFYKWEEK
jgi:hypothetical protein